MQTPLSQGHQFTCTGPRACSFRRSSVRKFSASLHASEATRYSLDVSPCASPKNSGRQAMRHAEQQARRLLLSTTASCLVTALFIASNLPALADSLPDSTLSTFALPGIDKIPIPTTQIQEPDFSQLTAEERLTVEIFDRNTPSVVNIANLAAYTRNPYAIDVAMIPQGTGSGFVWDKDGHVITNFHVVKGANAIKVTLYDSTSCSAKVVGVDENKDIAVLQLDIDKERASALRKVELGRSTGLFVGQQGVVSGLQREIQATSYGPKIKGVIQTDAAINPGNSGGVLLNSQGKLIGVNSAILDPSQRGAFSGVGFAIPIDMVKGLVDQILTYGEVIRPVLGITMGPPALISRLNIDGVLVYSAPLGTPAGDAGVQGCSRSQFGDFVLGDIIVGLDGKKVRNYADLFEALDEKKPGDKVALDVYRTSSRNNVAITVKLGQRTSSGDMQD